MTDVIHKYKMVGDASFAPAGKVLLVDYQGDGSELPTLWVQHDPISTPMTSYHIFATGSNVPRDGLEHVGSAICGRFVWHVYRSVHDDED